ncbi:phosphopantetheine-binding protein [Lentisphaera profundi]|uniref:Phosphopantetheine-binding protein n=1 Tax=Lentisphaera profundi TaxID=1658616 RepID=A0ABY7VR45_9BACT|nr:phosphopantetheine-binding protein [Lentisphaera profundi]WDE96331.1 phosphopantetheine-binding protein [Lentisphaera profundi]
MKTIFIRFILIINISLYISCDNTKINSGKTTLNNYKNNHSLDKKIAFIIQTKLSLPGNFDLDAPLNKTYGADDLDMVEVIMEIENEYEITIDDNQFFGEFDKTKKEMEIKDISTNQILEIVSDIIKKNKVLP